MSRRRVGLVGATGLLAAVVVATFFTLRSGDIHQRTAADARRSSRPGLRPGRPAGTLPESPSGVALDPSLFTRGSCVAYSPTSKARHETVFIDAGHGGLDPGAVGVTSAGATVYEADETLPVELDAATLLRAKGYRVVVSRTRQSVVRRLAAGDVAGGVFTVQGEMREIAARDICADLAKANVLVAIYLDAGGSELDAGSIATYDRSRPFWYKSVRLASLIQRDVLGAMNAKGWGIPDDGVVSDVSLGGPPLSSGGARYGHLMVLGPSMRGYFTTPSTMPGALIEPLFITDPLEATIAASAVGQRTIASGVAQAVEQYLATGPSTARRPTS